LRGFCFVAAGEPRRGLPLRPAGDPEQKSAEARTGDARWLGPSDRPDPLLGPALLRTGLAPFNASGSSKPRRSDSNHVLRSAPDSGAGRPQVHSPGRWSRRLVCPLVLGVCRRLRLRGSPDHVSALSRPGTSPGIRPVVHGDQLEGLAQLPWFPAAFPPPAFASWPSCSRQGIGPSSRSAYRPTEHGPDPDGVSTFRTHELRPGWVPSIPRGRRCAPGLATITSPRLPLLNGTSLDPATTTHPCEAPLDEASTRVYAIHRVSRAHRCAGLP